VAAEEMAAPVEVWQGLVFLDACCLINLFATGRAEEILTDLPCRFAVARYVAQEEVLEIGSGKDDDPSRPDAERVTLRPLIRDLFEREILEELDVTSQEEERELVRFATQLDDGEAHTFALAVGRDAYVATDDRKAIRVLTSICGEQGREPLVCRTSELLFSWAGLRGIGESELAWIIKAIARRASFIPPKDDPWCDRFMKLLRHD